MKSFDAFSRPVQEFRLKTASGGYLTVLSLFLVGVLFVSELKYHLQLETKDKIVIDQDQESKFFELSMKVAFHKAPCSMLAVNLLDHSRENILGVGAQIFKTRLSSGGVPRGQRIRESLSNLSVTNANLHKVSRTAPHHSHGLNATAGMRCASCFSDNEDECCDTCAEVQEAVKAAGAAWSSSSLMTRFVDSAATDYVFAQCADAEYQAVPPVSDEGCMVDLRMKVHKVPASLQIGVPLYVRKVQLPGSMDPVLAAQETNFDHEIHELRFGPVFPGLVHVLDGRSKEKHMAGNGTSYHHQYDVHVIPTRFADAGSEPVLGNQYSVTEVSSEVQTNKPAWEVPPVGLFLNYDFTPFEVQVERGRRKLWHFLTECCAILGGIFAFSGMLDNLLTHVLKAISGGGCCGLGQSLPTRFE